MSGNSLTISQTGLDAINTGLQAVADNIANVETPGFKSEAVLFDTLLGTFVGSSQIGGGADAAGVDRDFSAGAIQQSNSPTDLAIQGNGFFVFHDQSGNQVYSRDGHSSVSANGSLVNGEGDVLQGFKLSAAGAATGVLAPLVVPQGLQAPTASTQLSLSGNLDATAAVMPGPATANVTTTGNLNSASAVIAGAINPANAATFNDSFSTTVFDALGNAHTLTYFFQNNGAAGPNTAWSWLATLDGGTGGLTGNSGTVTFNPAGAVVAGGTGSLTAAIAGVGTQSVNLNFAALTELASATTASSSADGNAASTFESSVSVQTFDSLGTSHLVTFMFQNNGTDPVNPGDVKWTWRATVDGSTSGVTGNFGSFDFNSAGAIANGGTPATALAFTPAGAGTVSLALNFGSLTQFASGGATTGAANGNAVGTPQGVSVDNNGVISVAYSNGQFVKVGAVAIATFPSNEGLALTSGGNFVQTSASGTPTIATAGAGSGGRILPSSIESSNADITSQLVQLVLLQRSFQANAKALETSDAVLATLVEQPVR